jgi:hypothetical protein
VTAVEIFRLRHDARGSTDDFSDNIGVIVLPDQIAIPRASEAFGPVGTLPDPKKQAAIAGLGAKLARLLEKHKGRAGVFTAQA